MAEPSLPDLPPEPHRRSRREPKENPFRLSLAHFFLWTATTAVAVFLLQPAFDVSVGARRAANAEERAAQLPFVIVAVAVAPVYGAAILVLGMALAMPLLEGRPLKLPHPGHWFLMMIGSAFLGIGFFGRIGPLIDIDPPPTPPIVAFVATAAFSVGLLFIGLTLIFGLLAVTEVNEPPRWKVVFRLLLAVSVLATFGCCCAPVSFHYDPMVILALPAVCLLSFLVSLVVAAAIDIRSGERRDLAHWLGIVAVFTVVAHVAALIWIVG